MSRVEPLCFATPFTLSRIDSFCGSAISSRVARNRPERREGVRRLAPEALSATIELEVALGEIDADAVTEHVVERVALRDIDARLADHDRQFDFPVDALWPRAA